MCNFFVGHQIQKVVRVGNLYEKVNISPTPYFYGANAANKKNAVIPKYWYVFKHT